MFPYCCCTILVLFTTLLPTVVNAQGTRTSAVLSAGLNLGGIDDLLSSVRQDLLPELVLAMNGFIRDNLSFSTQQSILGGATVTVGAGISQFVLSTTDNSIGLQVEDDTPATASKVRLNASNLKMGATASANVQVNAFGVDVGCFLGVNSLADVPSLALALGVSNKDGGNDIAISASEASVPSFLIRMTPSTSTNDLCGVVNTLIATAFGIVADQISTLATSLFNKDLINGLAAVLDDTLVPIAQFNPSVSVGNTGVVRPSFAVESISAKSNTFVVDIGASLNVELSQPSFRAGRSLTASTSTTPNTMPQVTVERLLGMHLSLGMFNRMVESMWYLGRSALGGADDERLTQESSLCDDQAQQTDPCPFPPFAFSPGIFGEIVLFFLFFGNRNFNVEAILLPPAVDANNDDLKGSVKSRVAILGSGLLGGTPKVLATAGVDVELSTGLPRYDGVSGVISNVEITRINNVDFNLNYEGFPVFWIFTSLAQSFISSFAVTAANSFIDSANKEIAAFLERSPIKIPAIRKFPTARTDVEFRLSNVGLSGVPAGADTDGFLMLDAGINLAVLQRSDASSIQGPPAKSLEDIAPTVYREAYEAAEANADPNTIVARSYSSFDGMMVLYTCRWKDGQVEVLDTTSGIWSAAVAPSA